MFKLIKDRSGKKILVNTDKIEYLKEVDSGDTCIFFGSEKKVYLKGDLEINMPLLALKSGN